MDMEKNKTMNFHLAILLLRFTDFPFFTALLHPTTYLKKMNSNLHLSPIILHFLTS